MSTQSLGQIYKKQGADGPLAVKKEFTVLFDSIYIEQGFNAKRTIYRDVVEGMKNTLRKGEYLPKILVAQQSCGTRFQVVAGQHRYTAYAELIAEGMDFRRIAVEGFVGSESDKVKMMMKENSGRGFTPLEKAEGWARLINQFGWTRQEVADEFMVHLSSVAHHMAIADLPDSIKTLVEADRIAADYAVEVHRKHGEAAVIAMVEGSGEVKATRKNTNAWRPASGKKVCTILKGINVRPEGDCMVARFTPEEWEEVQAVLKTLGE